MGNKLHINWSTYNELCEKLILKTIDQQTYDRMGRCKYCQIDFEVNLKILLLILTIPMM